MGHKPGATGQREDGQITGGGGLQDEQCVRLCFLWAKSARLPAWKIACFVIGSAVIGSPVTNMPIYTSGALSLRTNMLRRSMGRGGTANETQRHPPLVLAGVLGQGLASSSCSLARK